LGGELTNPHHKKIAWGETLHRPSDLELAGDSKWQEVRENGVLRSFIICVVHRLL
jgi:hypothetical protein